MSAENACARLIRLLNELETNILLSKETKLSILSNVSQELSERSDIKTHNGQRLVRFLAGIYYTIMTN